MLRTAFALLALVSTVFARQPNVVLILADDLGYADLGCFGSSTIQTPHLDKLAAEGVKGTSFYVSQAVCSASRASLMTGCYANRVGMQGALNHTSREGLNASFIEKLYRLGNRCITRLSSHFPQQFIRTPSV